MSGGVKPSAFYDSIKCRRKFVEIVQNDGEKNVCNIQVYNSRMLHKKQEISRRKIGFTILK